MSRSSRVLLVLVLALVGSGCSATRLRDMRAQITKHDIVIRSDTIGGLRAQAAPLESRVPVDVLASGYAGDAGPFLDAFVDALDRHPALAVQGIRSRGHDAFRGRRRRTDTTAAVQIELSCRPVFSGTVSNAFVAFPGMIPFLPLVLGYRYDLALEVHASVRVEGGPASVLLRRFEASFRERGPPRSRLFYFWPSTGTLGTQFVMGLILAPFMIPYDGEHTTALLVRALEPRLGRRIASDIVGLVLHATSATTR